MNQKGFTLFTALIAFILIVLSLVLVQSMTATEASVSEIVTSISEQQEMQAIADLVRADALQGFNYGVRFSIEDFTKRNEYIIASETSDLDDWESMKTEFIADRFGVRELVPGESEAGQEFASLAANNLIGIIETTNYPSGFAIGLENTEPGTLTDALDDAFTQQAGESEFSKIYKCDGEDYATCIGTLYVTMDLSPLDDDGQGMSDEVYEKFPLVSVTNNEGRTLKEPILPRGKFTVYVPLRMFKALLGAQKIARNVMTIPRESIESGTISAIVENSAVSAGFAEGSSSDEFEFMGTDTSIVLSTDETPVVQQLKITMTFKENNLKYKINDNDDLEYKIQFIRFFE